MNKFYRFTGTAIAAVTLAAAAAAFGAPYAAAQPAAHQAAAAPAIATPAPQPMIPATLPAGAAGTSAIGNIKTVGSHNWSGYAVTGPKFRKVSATFFVPFLNCAVTPGGSDRGDFSSHWVGLDGFSSNTVEQDGIEADCSSGSPTYSAWREVFPRSEQPFTMKIKAGDSITASVRYSPSSGRYRLEVFDNTNGHHRTVHQKCDVSTCKRSSAEVISEAPSDSRGILPLADYGAESFCGISITSGSGRTGGIKSSHWSRDKIIQVNDSNAILARPTALNGRCFDNYWLAQS